MTGSTAGMVFRILQLPEIDTSWHSDAACRDSDPDLFFPSNRGGAPGAVRAARRFCERCPVAALCLEQALEVPPALDEGVWGGTTREERRRIRKRRAG